MRSLFVQYKNKFPQVGLAIILCFILFIENVVFMFLASQNIQQSNSSLFFYAISLSTILAFWVQHDSRSSGISMGMDQAMYIFFGWPIMFPVYVFRSRGFRRGGLLLLSLLGVTVFAFIAALIFTIVLNVGVAVFSAAQ